MSFRVTVKGGVIVLDKPGELPDGTHGEINTLIPEKSDSSLVDRYKGLVGILEGLPTDMAENHDHYIHGAPKQSK